jgi:hypothetical protein
MSSESYVFTADCHFEKGEGVFPQFDQLQANSFPDEFVPIGQQLN